MSKLMLFSAKLVQGVVVGVCEGEGVGVGGRCGFILTLSVS